MKDVRITKSALARALGCAKSRITQLAAHGLPTREDGRLDRREARTWIAHNISGESWYGGIRGGKISLPERAAALLVGKPPKPSRRSTPKPQPVEFADDQPTARELLDTLTLGSGRIVPMALKLGATMPQALAVASMFRDLVVVLGGDLVDRIVDWDADDDIREPDIDIAELAAKFGIEGHLPEWEREADALAECADPIIWEKLLAAAE
jgi:hypothetical protein